MNMSSHMCSRPGRTGNPMELLSLTREHWPMVREIYLAGILSGDATFETAAPSWEKWNTTHLSFARLVACVGTEVKGWAALSAVSARPAYSGVAEVSVYVASNCRGQGYGGGCLKLSLLSRKRTGSGLCKRASFPRTWRVFRCTKRAGSEKLGGGNALRN